MKATPKNVKPGVWLRTEISSRHYDPDVILECTKIKWYGDNNKNNVIKVIPLWDNHDGILYNPEYEYDVIRSLGIKPEQATWDEVMGNLEVINLFKEIKTIPELSIHKIIMEIMER